MFIKLYFLDIVHFVKLLFVHQIVLFQSNNQSVELLFDLFWLVNFLKSQVLCSRSHVHCCLNLGNTFCDSNKSHLNFHCRMYIPLSNDKH